jgi:hypothetical protein
MQVEFENNWSQIVDAEHAKIVNNKSLLSVEVKIKVT